MSHTPAAVLAAKCMTERMIPTRREEPVGRTEDPVELEKLVHPARHPAERKAAEMVALRLDLGWVAVPLFMVLAAEPVHTIAPEVARSRAALAATATRALSTSASRWTRAFITDEEDKKCDLQ